MTGPQLMHALMIDESDAPLRRVSVERPAPGPGQVLVRVHASAVNPLDVKIRSGRAPHARQPLPAILGLEAAGTVTQTGPGVAALSRGDEVYGLAGGVGGLQGTLAEFVAVDADLLAKKPARLDMRQAAAIPLGFITAWEGLVDHAGVQASHKVLVHGVGGVGLMAIQIARAFGAEVFALSSAAKLAAIERLGATGIDRDHARVEDYVSDHTSGRGFDIVYDTVGGPVLDASFAAVKRSGHVVSCLGWGTHALAPLSFKAATYSGVFTLLPLLTGEGRAHHGAILREATRLVESGDVMPRLDPRPFGLDNADAAYHALEHGDASGKVVVDVSA